MIWAGTSYGVSRYDGKTFASLTARDGLPHDSVKRLAVSGDGTVWAATQEGLARIAPAAGPLGEPLVVPLPPPLKMLGMRRLVALAASDKALWLSDGAGVVRFLDGKVLELLLPEATASRGIRALLPAGDEEAALLTADALVRLSATADPVAVPLPASLGDGIALVPAPGRLLRSRVAGSGAAPGAAGSVRAGGLSSGGRGADGVCAFRGGIRRGDGVPGPSRPLGGRGDRGDGTEEGLPVAAVNGVVVDRNGLLWLATEGGLVKLFDLGLRSIPSRPPQLGEMVLTAAPAGGGRIWVGHSDGLSIVAAPSMQGAFRWEGASRQSGLSCRSARARSWPERPAGSCTSRRTGSGDSGAASRGKGPGLRPRTHAGRPRLGIDPVGNRPIRLGQRRPPRRDGDDRGRGIPFGEARGLAVGPRGDVFVGTDGAGIVRWDGARFERFGASAGLLSGTARAVLVRPEGVWVGTDRGVFLLSEGRARPLADVNSALDDPYVAALAEAGGDVWVASSYSVFRVSAGKVVERVEPFLGPGGREPFGGGLPRTSSRQAPGDRGRRRTLDRRSEPASAFRAGAGRRDRGSGQRVRPCGHRGPVDSLRRGSRHVRPAVADVRGGGANPLLRAAPADRAPVSLPTTRRTPCPLRRPAPRQVHPRGPRRLVRGGRESRLSPAALRRGAPLVGNQHRAGRPGDPPRRRPRRRRPAPDEEPSATSGQAGEPGGGTDPGADRRERAARAGAGPDHPASREPPEAQLDPASWAAACSAELALSSGSRQWAYSRSRESGGVHAPRRRGCRRTGARGRRGRGSGRVPVARRGGPFSGARRQRRAARDRRRPRGGHLGRVAPAASSPDSRTSSAVPSRSGSCGGGWPRPNRHARRRGRR